jgi:predicted anti-sigma-YlaC factor YlaD
MKAALEKLYFFLILCSASGAISRIFGGSHAMQAGGTSTTALSGGDSDPVLFLFSAGIAVATCLLAFAKVPSIAAALARLPVLTALYTFAAVSVLWSDDRTSTIRGCAYLGLYLVSAAYLALRFDNEEIIRMVGNTAVLLALMSLSYRIRRIRHRAGLASFRRRMISAPRWRLVLPRLSSREDHGPSSASARSLYAA